MVRLLVVVASLLLVAVACSDDDSSTAGAPDPTPASSTTSTTEVAAAPDDVDCAAIDDARLLFAGSIQILAQLVSPAQYDLIADGTVVYDPAEVGAAIDAFRQLEGIETPLGSVQESLDLYERANDLAAENLAVDEPFADGRGDELAALVQPSDVFVGAQGPVNFAIGVAGCN